MKETLELLAAIELAAVSGIEISKGGITADDLPKALELIKKFETLVEGVKGFDKIDDEIKNIDQAGLIQLGTALFGTFKAIKAAAQKEVVA